MQRRNARLGLDEQERSARTEHFDVENACLINHWNQNGRGGACARDWELERSVVVCGGEETLQRDPASLSYNMVRYERSKETKRWDERIYTCAQACALLEVSSVCHVKMHTTPQMYNGEARDFRMLQQDSTGCTIGN